VSNQGNYATLGLVSAWMGHRLWADSKPSLCWKTKKNIAWKGYKTRYKMIQNMV